MGVSEGSLAEKPFVLLLAELHAAKAEGALKLRWGLGRRTIYFERGEPVFVSGTPMMDSLGTMLLTERRITSSARAEALRRSRVTKRPIGAALVELGALTPDELEESLGRQLENRVMEPFAWTGGDFVFEKKARSPITIRLQRSVDELLCRGIELGLACEPMEAWAQAAAGLSMLPGPCAQRTAGGLDTEQAAAALAAAGVTVGEFLDRCGLERNDALQLLTQLLALQQVALASEPRVKFASAPAPAGAAKPEGRTHRSMDDRRDRDADNLIRLGRVCLSRAKAGRRGFAEAAEVYLLRAAELQPANADPLHLLADLEQSRANHDLARRYQDKARRLSPAPAPRSSNGEGRARTKLAIGVFALATAALLAAPRLWAELAEPRAVAVEQQAPRPEAGEATREFAAPNIRQTSHQAPVEAR